ncbi:MAG: 5'/3'-nucleotidase SurE [Planctomycetaceae bacterium]|jgi:5'-nucleotidase|nr:5'/3'-nucleotidase SurE [Planctomycetaceae bacterium]
MRILLTNDDGIYAPGLAAMERALRRLGEVFVVAPSREQSGVAHSITFLTPLLARKVFVNDQHWGWTVDGSPADCVKLGVSTILPDRPDLIVSGMNGGLNAGINVLYSGTVGAAAEGAFYGITSIAVSLQFEENEPFQRAADLAVGVIKQIIEQDGLSGKLYNLNIPLQALKEKEPAVKTVPMDTAPYWETFERRTDPMGRTYYWLSGRPDPRQPKSQGPKQMTDLTAIAQGFITVTPLNYDVTDRQRLAAMDDWDLTPQPDNDSGNQEHTGPRVRVSWRS